LSFCTVQTNFAEHELISMNYSYWKKELYVQVGNERQATDFNHSK